MKKLQNAVLVLTIFVAFLTIAGCGGGDGCGDDCGKNIPPVAQDTMIYIASPGDIGLAYLNGSDEDGDALTFKVSSPPDGLKIDPLNSGTGSFSAIATKAGVYTIQFIANDGEVDSAQATLTVVVFEEGKFILNSGKNLYFKEPVEFWSNFDNPVGWTSRGVLQRTEKQLAVGIWEFGLTQNGTILSYWDDEFAPFHFLRLVGTYGLGYQITSDGVMKPGVYLIPDNPVPIVANAGTDQAVTDTDGNGEQSVNLDASKTTGLVSSYRWYEGADEIAVGEEVSVSLPVGIHKILMKACDSQVCVGDEIVVTVKAKEVSPEAPIANAGSDQTVQLPEGGTAVEATLDGSGSSDPDGQIVSYIWSKVGGNVGSAAVVKTTVEVGTTIFQLVVTDDQGLTDTDTVSITVIAGEVKEEIRFWFEGNMLRCNTPLDLVGPMGSCGNDRPVDWNFDGVGNTKTSWDMSWMVKGTSLHGGFYPPTGHIGESYDLITTLAVIEYDDNGNRHLVISRLDNGSFVFGRTGPFRYDIYPLHNCPGN